MTPLAPLTLYVAAWLVMAHTVQAVSENRHEASEAYLSSWATTINLIECSLPQSIRARFCVVGYEMHGRKEHRFFREGSQVWEKQIWVPQGSLETQNAIGEQRTPEPDRLRGGVDVAGGGALDADAKQTKDRGKLSKKQSLSQFGMKGGSFKGSSLIPRLRSHHEEERPTGPNRMHNLNADEAAKLFDQKAKMIKERVAAGILDHETAELTLKENAAIAFGIGASISSTPGINGLCLSDNYLLPGPDANGHVHARV